MSARNGRSWPHIERFTVTEADTNTKLVRNLHEYVGVFTQIAVFVSMLFRIYI